MARATRNVDIKLQFEQFDMMPGLTAKRFQRNLLIHGGKSDTQGFSITDCFLRVDAFAVAYGQSIVLPAPAGTVAAPGAAPGPAAGVGIVTARQARKARLKESFSFLIMHITDQSTLDLLGDPTSAFFQNGPDTFDWIMQQVIKPPSTGDLQDMTIAFWLIEIVTDVGISVNTITDAIKLLRVVNADFPVARRFSDDNLAEKLLAMIEHGSKLFALEAKKELDAVEGVPGTPGVRQYQLAVPVAGGLRPRDLNGLIVFWQGEHEQVRVSGVTHDFIRGGEFVYVPSLRRLSSYAVTTWRKAHHDALAHVMGYLFSDPDKGIVYGGDLKVPFGLEDYPANFSESRGLYVATDSSWGTKARPHGGHVVMRCNGAILWSAKTLKVVTDSTAHAEYMLRPRKRRVRRSR